VLPDADVWANAYDLFRFSERPGERGPEVRSSLRIATTPSVDFYAYYFGQLDDPRLDCAIMRPMESDGDHFLTYYLTKDDDAAELFKDSRADPRGVDALQEEEDVRFYLIFFLFSLLLGDRQPNSTLCAIMKWSKSNKKCLMSSSSSLTTASTAPSTMVTVILRRCPAGRGVLQAH
jgi:RNA polymerase II-associated factor 1